MGVQGCCFMAVSMAGQLPLSHKYITCEKEGNVPPKPAWWMLLSAMAAVWTKFRRSCS